MKQLLLSATALLAIQFASAQVFEERLNDIPSRWVNLQGAIFVQDSIYSFGSNGKVTAKEFNQFDENGFEIESHTVTIRWDGTESSGNKDEFVYDENGNEVKYSLYSWNGTEWTLTRVNEKFHTLNRLDSVFVNMYDKDLDEMFVKGVEKSTYGDNGELIAFDMYARAGVYDDLLPDMRFEYKTFNDNQCPLTAESFRSDGKGGLKKYMDIAFEYDKEGRLISYDYTAPNGDGTSTNIKKVEQTYTESGQLQSSTEFMRGATGEYVATRRTSYEYDDNGYPVKTLTASYTASTDTWRDGNHLEYYWRMLKTTGVNHVEADSALALIFDGRRVSTKGADIAIFDMQGHLMLKGQSSLDTTGLLPGIYVAVSDNGQNRSTTKIIVK